MGPVPLRKQPGAVGCPVADPRRPADDGAKSTPRSTLNPTPIAVRRPLSFALLAAVLPVPVAAQTPAEVFDAAAAQITAVGPDAERQQAAVAVEAFLRLPIGSAERTARLVQGAAAALAAERTDLAVQFAGEARRVGPATPRLVEWHLRALARAGQFAPFVDQALADAATDHGAGVTAALVAEEGRLLPMADLALRRGDTARGRFVFEALAAAAPDDAVRTANLALCQRNLGELEAAERSYRRARELSPRDNQLENDWGLFLRAIGQRAEALAAFRRSLALDTAVPGGRPGQGPGITNLLHAEALRPGGVDPDPLPVAVQALAVRPDAAMLRRLVLDVGLDRAVGTTVPR